MRASKRGLGGVLGTLFLLLWMSLGASPAHAGSSTPLSLSVIGTVVNAGTQTYGMSGGTVSYAALGGSAVTPSSFRFTVSSQVDGFVTNGSASFSLAGTSGGQSVTADGQVAITGMVPAASIPLGCTSSCDSELPLFFTGVANMTVTTGTGSPSTATQALWVESPYFNPFAGSPIVIATADCYTPPYTTCSLFIVTTYDTGTIQWQGTETSGTVAGTLGGSPVGGTLDIVTQESENLVAGTALDSGRISLSGMNASFLDVQGTYVGSSVIPVAGSTACTTEVGIFSQPCTADCSAALTGYAGTCTQTGFESKGQTVMQNSQFEVNGTYSSDWGVPAIGYYSTLTLTYQSLPSPSGGCGAVIQANPGQQPTVTLKGPPMFSTPNATNTLSFSVTMPDAVPASWLAGGCVHQDAASFSTLNVTRVAFSVDGGPLQSAAFSFVKHGEFECSTATSTTLMDDWQGCSGSITVVQVWSGSFTFTVMPTGIHSVKLEAWGQGGTGPSTENIVVDHSFCSYAGQPFVIDAQSFVGRPIVVRVSGLEPMLTSAGTVMTPISETYNTIVPSSGVIYGSFLPNGVVTVEDASPTDPWTFTLGDNPQFTQQLVLGE